MTKPDHAQFAAVDLGSNSFHMIVSRIENGQLRTIDKIREQVQLGLGMGDDKLISEDAWARGLDCLANFGQRLRGIPTANCRVVGTNTLRRALNGKAFTSEAQLLLGHDIEIISGREEARLIYEGVLHDASVLNLPRLVIDIGGGSTELIVGDGIDPSIMESISVGCVSMGQRHFSKGKITARAMRRTADTALMEIHPILHKYTRAQWSQVVGCSGTIKAIKQATHQLGYSTGDGFSAEALEKLSAYMQEIGQIDKLHFDGLPERRLTVLPSGLAVLQALFKALGIEHMVVSETALREGVIYDLIGTQHHADVQKRTIQRLEKQYNIDTKQSARVQRTAEVLQSKAKNPTPLDPASQKQMQFAIHLHELGWAVAHSHYHKHGRYLLANSDMRGFSHTEQQLLANLVRYHRRKLPQPLDQTFSTAQQQALLLLRLSIIINRDRQDRPDPPIDLIFEEQRTVLLAEPAWLENNPLTTAELQAECYDWGKAQRTVLLNPVSEA